MSGELWPVEQIDGEREQVSREVLLEASPEEVWEAIATEEGRERWLQEEGERDVQVVVAEEPERLVWWWSPDGGHEEPARVEFLIRAVAGGTRVLVVETAPRLPLEMLARHAGAVLV
ncbi:MAG TPA: hypothetical protein VMI13_12400 [Solirubrobacteraceae bacterium]|nr:hypothetical protein [Solirubrobacteraceae bacterium]